MGVREEDCVGEGVGDGDAVLDGVRDVVSVGETVGDAVFDVGAKEVVRVGENDGDGDTVIAEEGTQKRKSTVMSTRAARVM